MPPSTQPALPDEEGRKSSSSSKAQSATTYTQSRNRIDLILGSSHKSILGSLRAGRPSASPASSSNKATSGFSTLLSGSNSGPSATQTSVSAAATIQDEIEAEIASLRSANPGAGIGFGASNKTQVEGGGSTSAAQTAALRRRMGLGRNGRGGSDLNGARRRAREESSSDEEEGRSALGRRKFKKARAAHQDVDELDNTNMNSMTTPDSDRMRASAGRTDAQRHPEADTETAKFTKEVEDTPLVQQAPVGIVEGQEQSSSKKKKKKHNKKKNK